MMKPPNPHVSGYHWVVFKPFSPRMPIVLEWLAWPDDNLGADRGWVNPHHSSDYPLRDWEYLGPVLTPEEVEEFRNLLRRWTDAGSSQMNRDLIIETFEVLGR